MKRAFLVSMLVCGLGFEAWAQTPHPAPQSPDPAAPVHKQLGPADIIMPHITDSKHLEYPCIKSWGEWACHVTLPTWNVHIGDRTIDFGPDQARRLPLSVGNHRRVDARAHGSRARPAHEARSGGPTGFAAGIEGVILYLRNEIYMPVLGDTAARSTCPSA